MIARLLRRPATATVLRCTGVLKALEMTSRQRNLVVLNYHRVGTTAGNLLDDATYSATAGELHRQMTYLTRRFAVPALPQILDALERGRFDDPTALVTFDDGYRDNYELAFPVLRDLGVPGCFFVVSGYLDAPTLPWWDRIAYSIKRTSVEHLGLEYPEPMAFDLGTTPRARVTYRVLRAYKQARQLDRQRFFDGLAAGTGVEVDDRALSRDLFLSWAEAREMRSAGMTIGSHTVTHPILAAIPEDEQRREMLESRERIGEMVGLKPEALAYPVGGPSAFTEATKRIAREAGYRAAFRYFGRNGSGPADMFAISRFAVEHTETHAQFRLNTTLNAMAR
jgi:peptidoglycan/xylan/chitin deacetylase (PgdA/CDA1 family)